MAMYFECGINKNALLQTVFFLAILATGMALPYTVFIRFIGILWTSLHLENAFKDVYNMSCGMKCGHQEKRAFRVFLYIFLMFVYFLE